MDDVLAGLLRTRLPRLGEGAYRKRHIAIERLLALVWGFAEATLFFLVPDLLLSFVALKSRRAAAIAGVWVVAGALAGGAVMYVWGARDPDAAVAALDRVPAVSAEMISGVERTMQEHGMTAAFVGSFSGKPYKIYAFGAGRQGMNLALFLLISIPARLARFLLVVVFVHWLSASVFSSWTSTRKRIVLGLFWILFYAAFFALMPN